MTQCQRKTNWKGIESTMLCISTTPSGDILLNPGLVRGEGHTHIALYILLHTYVLISVLFLGVISPIVLLKRFIKHGVNKEISI